MSEVLGLAVYLVEDSEPGPLPKPGTKVRVEHVIPAPAVEGVPGPFQPDPPPAPPAGRTPFEPDGKPGGLGSRNDFRRPRPGSVLIRRVAFPAQLPEPKPHVINLAVPDQKDNEQVVQATLIYIEPVDSTHVYVDVASFNSKVYMVQGDVAVPGRLHCTGKETVLDALNYAGGLTPTGDPQNIHLYRPARGGKPVKDYKIDRAAILKGDARANLQLFPDDRLVIGRNAIVQRTVDIDRAAGPMNSVYNAMLLQAITNRAIEATDEVIHGPTPKIRQATFKAWSDFLGGFQINERGALFDAATFREAVMKKLAPPPPMTKE